MRIEHFGKDTEDRRFVLVDGAFNINVEEDGFRPAPGGFVDHHEGCRIVLELPAEHFYRPGAKNLPVFQDVGQHFQEMGFTASKEAGDPHPDVIGRLLEGIAVIIKKTDEVFFQLFGNDIFAHLLLDDLIVILIDLDHTVDGPVDALGKHFTYLHDFSPLI